MPTLTQQEYSRLKWACRRGMLELDLILIPFFEQHFTTLPESQKAAFIELLEQPDPDIFNWLMGYEMPEEAALAEIVQIIRYANTAAN